MVEEGYSEAFMVYTMAVICPTQYPSGLVVGSTGYLGVHLNDCETLENVYSFVNSEDQYYQ